MSAMMALPKDDPIMLAWEAYKITPEYANSRNWAKYDEHLDGSLWAAFLSGYQARSAHARTLPAAAVLTSEERETVERIRRDLSIFDDIRNDVLSDEVQHAKKRLGYISNGRSLLAIIARLAGERP